MKHKIYFLVRLKFMLHSLYAEPLYSDNNKSGNNLVHSNYLSDRVFTNPAFSYILKSL